MQLEYRSSLLQLLVWFLVLLEGKKSSRQLNAILCFSLIDRVSTFVTLNIFFSFMSDATHIGWVSRAASRSVTVLFVSYCSTFVFLLSYEVLQYSLRGAVCIFVSYEALPYSLYYCMKHKSVCITQRLLYLFENRIISAVSRRSLNCCFSLIMTFVSLVLLEYWIRECLPNAATVASLFARGHLYFS